MKTYSLVTILLIISWIGSLACNVTIYISNIRDSRGILLVCVFRDSAEFVMDTPFRVEKIDKPVKNNKVVVDLSLEEGIYGIVVHDDENANGIMDYNIAGIPKEGFGFSDYYLYGFKKPCFSDFSFNLNKSKAVEVKMRYVL